MLTLHSSGLLSSPLLLLSPPPYSTPSLGFILPLSVTTILNYLVTVFVDRPEGHQVLGKHVLNDLTARRISPLVHLLPDSTPHPPNTQREGRQGELYLDAYLLISSCLEAEQLPQV